MSNFDILCCSECKVDDYDEIELKNYTFYSQPRKQLYYRKSGGIGIFIKNSICKYVELIDTESDYVLWVKVKRGYLFAETDFIIGAVYIPPESSRFFNIEELSVFDSEINSMCNEYENVIIAGDTNGHTSDCDDFIIPDLALKHLIDFDDLSEDAYTQLQSFNIQNYNVDLQRKSCDRKTNSIGNTLLDCCKNNNLCILNGRCFSDRNIGNFTFKNVSVIDYIFCSLPVLKRICDFTITDVDYLYSDGHSLLSCTIDIATHVNTSQENIDVEQNCNSSKPRWNKTNEPDFFHNIDRNLIKNVESKLEDFSHQDIQQEEMLNEIVGSISKIFSNSSSKTFVKRRPVPKTDDSRKQKSWYGPQCRNKRVIYNRARKQYSLCKSLHIREVLKRASHDYKQTMNFHLHNHRFHNQTKLRNMNTKDPKSYWSFLNKFKRTNQGNTPTLYEFLDYFKTVNKADEDNNPNLQMDPNMNHVEEILNSSITKDEIEKMICKCKNGKACSSSDQILNEYLKSTKSVILPIYTKLFNIILDTGIIPKCWTEGYIIPIFKGKGPQTSPENYRPITILSCLGKLFTSVLNERLTKFVEHYTIMEENQAGFRKGHSTSDHIFVLNTLTELFRSQKHKLFVSFIDFSRCFDLIPRAELFHTLLNNGVHGKFV